MLEKALSHTIGGIRGVYNRAEYAQQRRDMCSNGPTSSIRGKRAAKLFL